MNSKKKRELLFREENKSQSFQIDAYFLKDGKTFGVKEERGGGQLEYCLHKT